MIIFYSLKFFWRNISLPLPPLCSNLFISLPFWSSIHLRSSFFLSAEAPAARRSRQRRRASAAHRSRLRESSSEAEEDDAPVGGQPLRRRRRLEVEEEGGDVESLGDGAEVERRLSESAPSDDPPAVASSPPVVVTPLAEAEPAAASVAAPASPVRTMISVRLVRLDPATLARHQPKARQSESPVVASPDPRASVFSSHFSFLKKGFMFSFFVQVFFSISVLAYQSSFNLPTANLYQ